MRGTVMYAAGDVRIENVPDPAIPEPTDAVIRVTRACICGSDLWPYKTLQPSGLVSERGDEAVERVRELTDGHGVDAVLECVGLDQSMETAIEIARPGGAVGRVGVPQHELLPGAEPSFFKNVTIGGGPAPVRAYIDELLPDVLDGRIEPGRVFDRTVDLDGVPEGYWAMNDRESIKVLIEP